MTITTAVYLRVSLDATGEHLAVSRQRDECRSIAAERGWEVVDEYVDNSLSASKATVKRPAYDRMVADYEAGRFGALVCWDLDRLTRQPRQLEDWIDAAQQRGLLLTTANGEADLSTDGGRLFARIKASVARAEIERKSARQTAAAAQRAEHGKVPRGVRLTGYTVAGKVRCKEADLVRAMFDRFLKGDSLRGIAAWASTTDVPARTSQGWKPSSVRTILTNPRYAGRAVYKRVVTGQRGQWEPLVDEATFDTVQDRLRDPRRKMNRVGTDRKYLGASLFRCGVCDGLVRSHSGGRYRCPEGGHITRMAPSIDDLVERVVAQRLARADLVDLLAPPEDGVLSALAARVKVLRDRLARVEADYDEDLIDGRRYAVKTEKLRAELQSVENERARRSQVGAVAAMLEENDPARAFLDAPLGIRRSVMDALVMVRLDPAPRGHKFTPSSVRIEWNGAQ